jgi:hypothetical protein
LLRAAVGFFFAVVTSGLQIDPYARGGQPR